LRQELAFAECMRRNGVPDFPDLTASGPVRIVTAGAGSPASSTWRGCAAAPALG
jgi:hypothetical protein